MTVNYTVDRSAKVIKPILLERRLKKPTGMCDSFCVTYFARWKPIFLLIFYTKMKINSKYGSYFMLERMIWQV